jgi:hypothetical protein
LVFDFRLKSTALRTRWGLFKADLEAPGHDIWFDKNEIKFGDDWRRSLTDGTSQRHRVPSFLSKHSTRDPGVRRDETAIAVGVIARRQVVTPRPHCQGPARGPARYLTSCKFTTNW